jgi:hypothetical protein
MKNVKAILLDSKKEKVTEIMFDGNYNNIHQLLGKDVSQIHWDTLSSGDLIYYDFEQDENYTKKSKGFMFENGYCRYGNGLIIGNQGKDNDGYNWTGTNVNLTKEMIESEVTFGKIESVNVVV